MSALQDMVDDMVAEHETSPADHFPELGTERRAEGPADETHVGASRWLSDRSVGQKLWAVSSSNIAVVLLCLIATCLGGYFALEARNERMAISSASIMAERMVADIGEGRLFVQRFAVSGDPNDLVAAQDAFDQTDRDLSRIEEQAIEVAPAVDESTFEITSPNRLTRFALTSRYDFRLGFSNFFSVKCLLVVEVVI